MCVFFLLTHARIRSVTALSVIVLPHERRMPMRDRIFHVVHARSRRTEGGGRQLAAVVRAHSINRSRTQLSVECPATTHCLSVCRPKSATKRRQGCAGFSDQSHRRVVSTHTRQRRHTASPCRLSSRVRVACACLSACLCTFCKECSVTSRLLRSVH